MTSTPVSVSFVHQVVVDNVLRLVERQLDHRNPGGTQGTSTSTQGALAQASSTSSSPASTSTMPGNNNNGSTSSPLLFFVALGFGVVFTNLW